MISKELYQIFPDSTLLADPPGLFLPGVLVDTDADRIFCLAAQAEQINHEVFGFSVEFSRV